MGIATDDAYVLSAWLLTVAVTAVAASSAMPSRPRPGGDPLPARVALYFEAWTGRARRPQRAVGRQHLTMAFLQTAASAPAPCTGTVTPGCPSPSPPSALTSHHPVPRRGRHPLPSAATPPTPPAPRSPTAAPTSTRSPPRTRRSSRPTTSPARHGHRGRLPRQHRRIDRCNRPSSRPGPGRRQRPPDPDLVHPADDHPRPAASGLYPQERRDQRRARRRRQPDDLRLLRQRRPRHGRRHQDGRPGASYDQLAKLYPTKTATRSGAWSASPR